MNTCSTNIGGSLAVEPDLDVHVPRDRVFVSSMDIDNFASTLYAHVHIVVRPALPTGESIPAHFDAHAAMLSYSSDTPIVVPTAVAMPSNTGSPIS